MKSNIGFVFVVNSEKAFGRFVKESAGEEEMTSCSSSGEWLISSNFKLSSRRRESSREREESREALRQNLSGKRIPNFLFGTSNQIFGFFSSPPPQKNAFCFLYFSRRRLPIVSQSVTSAYIVRRAFTDLLSGGAQLGGVLFFILVSSVHC